MERESRSGRVGSGEFDGYGRLTDRGASELAAILERLWTRGRADRSIDATSPVQRREGGIDDHVDLHGCDVTASGPNLGWCLSLTIVLSRPAVAKPPQSRAAGIVDLPHPATITKV